MARSGRRFADPVHGTIPLSQFEVSLIDAAAFQRLRHIKQLGLADYVFPGANYTRFAHSLGTRHVVRLSLESLSNETIVESGRPMFFGAASLLHDVGHYPFSHAMEDALGEYHNRELLVDIEAPHQEDEGADSKPYLDHVELGREVLRNDDQLGTALQSVGLDADEVANAFSRNSDDPLINLISSDLDADRIDFLLRTAHHSGLPYGHVDLDYVLGHLIFDRDGSVCLHKKALRTVDHMLLCRFFDYQQVVFQKTVVGLEELLKSVLIDLVDAGLLPSSADQVRAKIRDGTWAQFDDVQVLGIIRNLAEEATDGVIKSRASALVKRSPPKLVHNQEVFLKRKEKKSFIQKRDELAARKEEWAEKFGIPSGLWWVWGKTAELTSTWPVPLDASVDEIDPELLAKAVRIADDDGSSAAITDVPASLMSVLGDRLWCSLRVFVLLPEEDARRESIEAHITTLARDLVDL